MPMEFIAFFKEIIPSIASVYHGGMKHLPISEFNWQEAQLYSLDVEELILTGDYGLFVKGSKPVVAKVPCIWQEGDTEYLEFAYFFGKIEELTDISLGIDMLFASSNGAIGTYKEISLSTCLMLGIELDESMITLLETQEIPQSIQELANKILQSPHSRIRPQIPLDSGHIVMVAETDKSEYLIILSKENQIIKIENKSIEIKELDRFFISINPSGKIQVYSNPKMKNRGYFHINGLKFTMNV
ncbi:MAG: hypothetical protein ACXAC7_02630 [Candidatus Hodarchaeales archaeon]|jgi:hypothetical protein